ncbi:MAG: SPFH domain-containing protein [Planctomycetota bacterium]|nr:SPFH domain-containing protein [Planctomycetota bacterium]
MATISCFFGLRHLRSDPSHHVLHYRRGRCVRSGRGLAFWFLPLSASLVEIPLDDRDESFLFHARSRDYQDVTAQGVITYRVADPERLARRIDFTIDLHRGLHRHEPLEQLSALLVQAAQQHAWRYLAGGDVRELLADGVDHVRDRIAAGLEADDNLAAMGLEIVAVRVAAVAPTADLEKALQAPAHEAIQQEADEAIFQRRALAVEKERAIQENELQNQIELSRREEQLITQRGQNDRQRSQEEAAAARIGAEAKAERRRLASEADALAIRLVEEARVQAEGERVAIYRDLPRHVLVGLAAAEFAGKLEHIDHISVGSDMLAPVLTDLVRAGTERIEHANGEAKRRGRGGK